MLHKNMKGLIDVIVPENVAVAVGYSPSFVVVSENNFKGTKAKTACLAVKTTAAGSVTVQVYYRRYGLDASLLTTPMVLDTANQYLEFTDFTNTILTTGDLLFARVMDVSGAAKGLTLSIDFS